MVCPRRRELVKKNCDKSSCTDLERQKLEIEEIVPQDGAQAAAEQGLWDLTVQLPMPQQEEYQSRYPRKARAERRELTGSGRLKAPRQQMESARQGYPSDDR